MKKIFIIAAFAVVGLTSCKKDRTCTCIVSGTALPVIPINNSTKDDAESVCDLARSTYQAADPNATCTLD